MHRQEDVLHEVFGSPVVTADEIGKLGQSERVLVGERSHRGEPRLVIVQHGLPPVRCDRWGHELHSHVG